VPHGSVTSRRSTVSGVVCDVLRDLGFPPSPTRVCDEAGVGTGEREAALVDSAPSSTCSGEEDVCIGGKDVEKNVGGRIEGFFCDGGMR